MKIVNFGSMNLDHIYAVPHMILGGETLLSTGLTEAPGGKGLNQSIAVARAGAPISHAGMLGQGGEPLKACLEESGVDTSLMVPCSAPQGHTVIQVIPGGQNSIIVYGGSNQLLTREHIDRALDTLPAGGWVMAQNEISNLDHILDACAARGLRLVLNASPINDGLLALDFSKVAWLVVNELEAAAIAGCDDPWKAAAEILARFPGTALLLTLGESGSVSWEGGVEVRQPAFPARAVDTTAAGDTFMGYFVAAMSRGEGRQQAMRTASMASSIAVSRPGAAPSIPVRAEVEAALAAL